MKIFVLVSLVLVIATVISAAPYELSSAGGLEPIEEIVKEPLEERATRQKRAICLYTPLLGGIRDLICSGTCLLVGKPGGHCDGNGECTCEEAKRCSYRDPPSSPPPLGETKKNKIYVLVSLVLVIATVISAAPYELSSAGEFEPLEEIAEEPLEERATRQRRVTCDLLSAGGFVGDTACAANCLSMGKAGGHCNGSGVCVCRQDSIKDLFNKRFG